MAHRFFGLFLLFVAGTAILVLSLSGWEYYTALPAERAFMPEHVVMRPSGNFSHGLGVIGATMITVGVIIYSTRKRVKALWDLGKLSVWLEVHITLCLLGPILVLYHSTFKVGGIAAISLWTMLSVAGSGIIGRFLYGLIPRTTGGGQMTTDQINQEFDRISQALLMTEEGKTVLKELDQKFASLERPANIVQTASRFLQIRGIRNESSRWVSQLVKAGKLSRAHSSHLKAAAAARARLLQKSVLMIQVEQLFYYWHAIHLPFTIIMFITLAAHIGVAVWLGYTWIF